MPNIPHLYDSRTIFEYKTEEKQKNAVLLLGLGLFLFVVLGIYVAYSLFGGEVSFLKQFKKFQKILSESFWGVYLTSTLGGLFFIAFPLEIMFYHYLNKFSNPWIVLFLYHAGFLTAQSINYLVGSKANRLSKLLIPTKKFYRIKGALNRYGIRLVIFMNLLPLPSPILSVILGSFQYSFKRFFVFMSLSSFFLYSTVYGIHILFQNTK